MLNRLFGSGSVSALETMLQFASARQKAIATNLANLDTVGYRTRDVSEADDERLLDLQQALAKVRTAIREFA